MTPRPRWAFLLSGLLVAWAAQESWAGQADHLKTSIDRVIKILEDPALKAEGRVRERRMAIRQAANAAFDFAEIAKRALARHWQGRTDREREEFVTLFADLLERSYISKLALYAGEKVQYGCEQVDGDFSTVATRIVTKQGQELSDLFLRGAGQEDEDQASRPRWRSPRRP